MAQKVLVSMVDDTDGSEATDTVRFGLDGAEYEIDLSADNAAKLRKGLERYTEAARRTTRSAHTRPRVRGGGGRASVQSPGVSSEEIRTWAKQRGYKVNDRGRIPAAIVMEYNAHRGNGAAAPPVQESTAPPALQQLAPKEDIAPEPEPATVKSGPARGSGRRPAAKPAAAKPAAEAPAADAPAPRARGGRKPKTAEAKTA